MCTNSKQLIYIEYNPEHHHNGINLFCPACDKYVGSSQYLNAVFREDKIRWLANMITHYRHSHNRMYNEMCRQHTKNFNLYYDKVKAELNEGVKRKLILNHTDYLISNGITSTEFSKLMNTTAKTIELAKSKLGK